MIVVNSAQVPAVMTAYFRHTEPDAFPELYSFVPDL